MTTVTTDLFAIIDSKDAHGFASQLSENCRMQIGSAAPITGRAAVEAGLSEFFGMIKSLRHDTVQKWDMGDTTIIQSAVTYVRLDDRQLTIPAATIYHRGAELIDDYHIFIDLTPVLA